MSPEQSQQPMVAVNPVYLDLQTSRMIDEIGALRAKIVDDARQFQTLTTERDALKVQVDAFMAAAAAPADDIETPADDADD